MPDQARGRLDANAGRSNRRSPYGRRAGVDQGRGPKSYRQFQGSGPVLGGVSRQGARRQGVGPTLRRQRGQCGCGLWSGRGSAGTRRGAERYAGAADPALFAQPEERDLYDRLGEVRTQNGEALKAERFGDAMQALSGLRRPVDRFFDEVTVNCDKPKLRENRLRLLSTIQATMNRVADFSKIEG
ncbi:MAG: hypothetical protein IH968_13575 [Gemmatimonadetes bacterium]|nr:hypothetical protein [Gemmatimonadota bacterium]